jgi:hypothetical protein
MTSTTIRDDILRATKLHYLRTRALGPGVVTEKDALMMRRRGPSKSGSPVGIALKRSGIMGLPAMAAKTLKDRGY